MSSTTGHAILWVCCVIIVQGSDLLLTEARRVFLSSIGDTQVILAVLIYCVFDSCPESCDAR
jgi:hypothetical protein